MTIIPYVHIKDGKVWREHTLDTDAKPPDFNKIPEHKKSYLKPLIREPVPVIDEATQVLGEQMTVIEDDVVRYVTPVRNKTVREKRDYKAKKDRRKSDDLKIDTHLLAAIMPIRMALFDTVNKLRVLEEHEPFSMDEYFDWLEGFGSPPPNIG